MRWSLLVVTSALAACAPSVAHAAEGDIIVQRAPGADRQEVRRDAGVKLVTTLPLERTEVVEPARGESVDSALAALNADPGVVYAEPDREVSISRMPSDGLFGSLWGLRNTGQNYGLAGADIDASLAWDHTDGSGITVAVVDTGVSFSHPDLAGQLTGNPAEINGRPFVDDDRNGFVDDYRGWDFYSRDNLPQDGSGHGTHVAGTIAAEGFNGGVIGVAPGAKLIPLRVLGNNGTGYMSTLAAAFQYAGELGVRIVNASLGGGYSRAVQEAIAAHPKTLFVVAAGNDAANADTSGTAYPCRLPEPNIVCVGASTNRDAPAAFSNYGKGAVDLFAPGVDIVSAYKAPWNYASDSGTSMAAPHVAGAAALALALRPDASASFLRWSLLASADARPALAGLSATGGRLNANRAVAAIRGEEPKAAAPAPTPTPVVTPPPAPPATAPAPPAPAPPQATPPAPAPEAAPAKLAITKLAVRKHKLSFRLSHASKVKVTVTRGRKRIKSWTVRGRAGANTVKLRSSRKRGSYRVTVAAGSVSRSRAFKLR